ncbi:MAG: 4-(cytidine 5'-diphospho)-2-C-methyl-D-erythritol kinase [Puniceicoccaceae bacterium]
MRLFSPAKINLFLAVTGRRADGFHDLVSVAAPLAFGDGLTVDIADGPGDELFCDHPAVPAGPDNLVRKAAVVFRRATGLRTRFVFRLEKRIPPGGGFGGGSGNAARALEAMNALSGNPLPPEGLSAAALAVGSDCPLFLAGGPVVMRGRGGIVEPLPDPADFLSGWRVGLFDPGFASATGDLYRSFAGTGRFTPPEAAESTLAAALEAFRSGDPGPLLRNDLGSVLAGKYLFYGTLASILAHGGLPHFGITGSGSGCFVLFRGEGGGDVLRAIADEFLGPGFLVETGFAAGDDARVA